MKTPPWKLIVPTVCFDLCKYTKSDTDPTLYRLHYSELLESFMDYTHIFTDGSKDGDKTVAAFICQSFEFSKRLPDKASIFTAELEAIVSKWDHPTVQTIMKFLVFLHTVLCNHVLACLSTGLLNSTLYSILFFTQSPSLLLITCSYHLSLPLLMTVMICSTPTNSLKSSLVLLTFMETSHINLIIYCIFVFLEYTHSGVWSLSGVYLSLLRASHLHVSISRQQQ